MNKQSVWIALFFAICCVAVIVISACVVNESVTESEPVTQNADILLDTDNAAQMHKYGLPTKADCMQWHIHGQWGWIEDGKLYAFDELPGKTQTWDELYDIKPNPAFDK